MTILKNITYTLRCGHQSDRLAYPYGGPICLDCRENLWDTIDDLVLPAVNAYWKEQNK